MSAEDISKLKKLIEDNPLLKQELEKQMKGWIKNLKNKLALERIIRRGERESKKVYE